MCRNLRGTGSRGSHKANERNIARCPGAKGHKATGQGGGRARDCDRVKSRPELVWSSVQSV